jgi:hypothetical protein
MPQPQPSAPAKTHKVITVTRTLANGEKLTHSRVIQLSRGPNRNEYASSACIRETAGVDDRQADPKLRGIKPLVDRCYRAWCQRRGLRTDDY